MMFLVMFLMAAAADWLSCEWHQARERRQLARLGALSAVIEALNWIPVYVAIVQEDISLVIAAILGSVVGAVIGGARQASTSHHTSHTERSCRPGDG